MPFHTRRTLAPGRIHARHALPLLISLGVLATAALLGLATPAQAHDGNRATGVFQEHCSRHHPVRSPRGVVLWIRGSGWTGHPRGEPRSCGAPGQSLDEPVSGYPHNARSFAAASFTTVSVGYTGTNQVGRKGGIRATHDALRAYDELERYFDGPICVGGNSSGMHTALAVAQFRPGVDCVIGEAGVSDLELFKARRPLGYFYSPEFVFGRYSSAFSPAQHAEAFGRRRVMLAHVACDPVAPPEQGQAFADVHPNTTLHLIRAGQHPVPWMHALGPPHCGVLAEDFIEWHSKVRGMLRAVRDR